MHITETVLEMHYHKPLMDLFRKTYGLGSTGKINFYKYSPQREVFLGFDQAFAMTELTDAQFFAQMKSSAMNNGYKLSSRFIAYFLQFKVVAERQNWQKKMPPQIWSKPYYRAALDTTKNENTGFSQHELLYSLNKNDGAMVYYACPMIFEKSDLYEVNVSLEPLRLVDLDSCPSDFTDNSKHYIYFDQKQSQPIWCSDPTEGKALTPKQFSEKIVERLRKISPFASVEQLFMLLSKMKEHGSVTGASWNIGNEISTGLSAFADSLTIIRLDEEIREG
ncbi:hypothetical protein [Azonexus sp.]|jgi:hypothetical protein|uniref:hypothetical protein n=1 Tax=Azonexus sp. TaxID=1872668 RepID=UPI00283136A6|nr:hypothetical protein [Azonexus sp.]MDR1994381.1 hypothetical protein [Azonexus sp.]